MNNEDSEFLDEPKFSRAEFDYKQMLLIHLRNMSKLVTSVIFPSSREPYSPDEMVKIISDMIDKRFHKGVFLFQQLLSPYFDDKYHDDMKKLNEENLDVDSSVMKVVGILIQLMERKNLLLEKEEESKL